LNTDYYVNFTSIAKCPFCNDDDGIYYDFEDRIGNYHFVGCLHCNVNGPSNLNRDMQIAADGSIVKWNLWTLVFRLTILESN